ncbi:MAG: hypothetical protein JWM14_501 [Chitinophagaceae bacterium]|nr:hypothetical protein [Chitinophagaceae bacterium]
MNPLKFFREILLLGLLILSIVLYSCRCDVEEPQPLAYNYLNVPEGDTAVVENLNIAGMGARKNNPHTTWIIKGHVVMDELQVMGHVIIEKEASLTILKTIYIQEEGVLTVKNQLSYKEIKQEGKIYYYSSAD